MHDINIFTLCEQSFASFSRRVPHRLVQRNGALFVRALEGHCRLVSAADSSSDRCSSRWLRERDFVVFGQINAKQKYDDERCKHLG